MKSQHSPGPVPSSKPRPSLLGISFVVYRRFCVVGGHNWRVCKDGMIILASLSKERSLYPVIMMLVQVQPQHDRDASAAVAYYGKELPICANFYSKDGSIDKTR
ncbi:hypothetical protein ACH5RR_008766 [Cinchona calisaya]|uniref:Uncharacterized protein n=1 Tax=Cinchona calisaya TaxID=153742 RepID=A0ABD3AE23_9GENT